MRPVLLLVPDLFFRTRIESTARAIGVAVRALALGDQPAAGCRGAGAGALVVDLDAEGCDFQALARSIRETPDLGAVRLVGFFSHVDVERRDRAREAGFDLVLPRSKFTADLPRLLAELAGLP